MIPSNFAHIKYLDLNLCSILDHFRPFAFLAPGGLCVFQVAVGGGLVVKVLDRAEKEILARPAVCRHGCGIPITLGIQKVRALATVCVGN